MFSSTTGIRNGYMRYGQVIAPQTIMRQEKNLDNSKWQANNYQGEENKNHTFPFSSVHSGVCLYHGSIQNSFLIFQKCHRGTLEPNTQETRRAKTNSGSRAT